MFYDFETEAQNVLLHDRGQLHQHLFRRNWNLMIILFTVISFLAMLSLQIIAKVMTAQLQLVDSNLDTTEKNPISQYESGQIKLLV